MLGWSRDLGLSPLHGAPQNRAINATQCFSGFGMQKGFCGFLFSNRYTKFKVLLLSCYSIQISSFRLLPLICLQFMVISKTAVSPIQRLKMLFHNSKRAFCLNKTFF